MEFRHDDIRRPGAVDPHVSCCPLHEQVGYKRIPSTIVTAQNSQPSRIAPFLGDISARLFIKVLMSLETEVEMSGRVLLHEPEILLLLPFLGILHLEYTRKGGSRWRKL